MSNWIEIEPFFEEMPEAAGCYVFLFEDRYLYVGSTSSMRKRFYQHSIELCRYSDWFWTPWGMSRSVRVMFRRSRRFGDWLMWEARLIRKLRPALNGSGQIRITDRDSKTARLRDLARKAA